MSRKLQLLICTAALILAPRAASAQTWQAAPPALTAEAVLLAPLSGGALNHLQFGDINPADSARVSATVGGGTPNEAAGKWSYTLSNNVKRVWIGFQLPTVLTHNLYPAHTIPIDFNFAGSAGLCELKAGSCLSFTMFNASLYQYPTGYEHVLLNRPNVGAVHVYLGGMVRVPATARAGTYTATVTLRVGTANN